MKDSGGERAARRLTGFAIITVLSLVLGLFIGKYATFFTSFNDANSGVLSLYTNPIAPLFSGPILPDFSNATVLAATATAAAIPWIMLLMFGKKGQKLENEDTGREHGADRLATMKEMSAPRDQKHLYNNILYSEHTGIVLHPYDKRTRAQADGRNHNTCTFGISGLGKTFNLVKPNIMQAVGDALPAREYGAKNILLHFKLSSTWKLLCALGNILKSVFAVPIAVLSIPVNYVKTFIEESRENRDIDKEEENKKAEQESPSKDEVEKETPPESQEADEEELEEGEIPDEEEFDQAAMADDSEDQEAEDSTEPMSAEAQKRKETAEKYAEKRRHVVSETTRTSRNAVNDAVDHLTRVMKMREAEKKKVDIGAGFDIVNTDPKGENVEDVGWMLLAAGFDVKVVNTIDFEKGLHINPLAYIDTRLVDIKDAEEIKVDINVYGTSESQGKHSSNDSLYDVKLSHSTLSKFQGSSIIAAEKFSSEATFELNTDVVSLSETPRPPKGMTIDELEAAIDAAEPGSKEFETLRAQRDMKWMEEDMGAYIIKSPEKDESDPDKYQLVGGSGCSKVANAVKTMRYKRTTGQLVIRFQNNDVRPLPAKVEIELDPALVVNRLTRMTQGGIEWPTDAEGNLTKSGKLVWHLPAPSPKPRRSSASEHHAEELVLDVHIQPTKVADGVWLTKTVDCLCANLRGTDAASNSSEDPFWEDTKRLCFMSLIAFLFERYDEKYHTLPDMMKLLDIVMADDGDPKSKSPLAVLMEMWEKGLIYEPTAPGEGEGGGKVRGGRYVKADNQPHSRSLSMALNCYYAFTQGAPETVQSIVISCRAALINLLSDDVKDMLAYDELHLETLGDADQKQAIFIITKDTDSPFDFLTALITFQAIDIAQEKAYKRYGGKLPRHVRFELDEVANIGSIPILVRAMAVVRSRNISISMYLQSKAQLAMVYGEKEADVILDNCSAILFLGAQTEDTLEWVSKKTGVETVQSRLMQHSVQDNALIGSTSEQVSSNERPVMSSSELSRMEKGWMMVFLFNQRAAYDHKFKTLEHPYYAYIDPTSPRRDWRMALPVFDKRFDYSVYRKGGYNDEITRIREKFGTGK